MPDGDNALLPTWDFPSAIQAAEGSGPDAVSPRGASGTMQVMPGTMRDPGFGLAPVDPNDSQAVAALGRQYASAMLRQYGGNPTLAAAAYNAGPGRVDEWIAQNGDPRTGAVSDADWLARVPYDETRNYVARALGARMPLQASGAAPPSRNQTNSLMPQVPAPASAMNPPGTTPPSPAVALQLLSLLLPRSHGLQPVDYDPWALAPKRPGGQGNAG